LQLSFGLRVLMGYELVLGQAGLKWLSRILKSLLRLALLLDRLGLGVIGNLLL
jgi:hypothetical protein